MPYLRDDHLYPVCHLLLVYPMFQLKRAKNSYEGYPTEFAGSTQNHEKMKQQNEKFKKKVCSVPQKSK
jgi:hypothetical protein